MSFGCFVPCLYITVWNLAKKGNKSRGGAHRREEVQLQVVVEPVPGLQPVPPAGGLHPVPARGGHRGGHRGAHRGAHRGGRGGRRGGHVLALGGHLPVPALRGQPRIPFSLAAVRPQDVITLKIDFLSTRYPILRRWIGDRIYIGGVNYPSICAGVARDYDFTIYCLRRLLAPQGRTFELPNHPIKLDFYFRSEFHCIYETSILIHHSNMYGYAFRCMGRWLCFNDCPYNLLDEAGRVVTAIGENAAYCEGCYDSVGLCSIMNALRDLNCNSTSDYRHRWKKSVLHLCLCFIEAARFPHVYELVRMSIWMSFVFPQSLYQFRLPVQDFYGELVHSWGALCEALDEHESTGEWRMSSVHSLALGLPENNEHNAAVLRAREMVAVRTMRNDQ